MCIISTFSLFDNEYIISVIMTEHNRNIITTILKINKSKTIRILLHIPFHKKINKHFYIIKNPSRTFRYIQRV